MKKNYEKILFINFGGIGDEILFLPAIQSVKKQYPDAKITLTLESRSKSITTLTNLIDNTISLDIKAKGIKKYLNVIKFISKARSNKFDCIISSGKSPFIAIILFLTGIKERIGYCSKTDFLLTKKVQLQENQYAGIMYHDLVKPICDVEFENPKIDINKKIDLDKNFKIGEYICIHPGVSKMSVEKNILKCPNKTFWINLIKELLNKNKQVILLGSKDDESLINEIISIDEISNNVNFNNYYNKTKSLLDLAEIMKNSSYVICVDSAPLHVAVASQAKTIAIFGPTNEKKLVPENSNVIVISKKINCRPCLWHKRSANCESSNCLEIDYNEVLSKIN